MLQIGTSLSRIFVLVYFLPTIAFAQKDVSSFSDWLQLGQWIVDARYRLEHVDQDGFDEDALASTLRVRGGFETARWSGFSAIVEAELVRPIGSERYNSTTNGRTAYPVVADPETTEINRALLYYRGGQNHLLLGRQELPIEQERFLSSVDFRQNQQTYDALMYMNRMFQGWTLVYGYMDRVRRFLSDDHPVGEIEMKSHVVDIDYETPSNNRVTIYGHFFDMETPAVTARSHRNIGVRLQGSTGSEALKWLYHAEYADQSSYASGADSIDADYWRAELGPRFSNQWVLRLGIEHLGGNGTYAFQTPFGNIHEFNGRADLFAAGTPADGLVDKYVALEVPLLGARTMIAYHQFDSDAGDLDYGSELDVAVTYRFREKFEFAFEFARFNAKNFSGDKRVISMSLSYTY